MLYPQNGDRIVAIDFVTSLHAMYRNLSRARWLSCCLDTPVGTARCKDTSDYFEDGNSCYVLYGDEFAAWYNARNRCLRKGGDLATFTDVDSNVGVGKLAAKRPHWIGLRNSWWTWPNGRQSS